MGTEPERFDVVLAKRDRQPVWWAPLSGPLEKLIASIPTHRDTKSGRKNASQIRLVMLSSGVLVVVLWNSPWAPLALFLCLGALVVPMSDSRRRSLRAKLRSSRTREVVRRTPASLEIDERHVTLEQNAERIRRLRRKGLEVERDGEHVVLRAGKKKRDRLVVGPREPSSEELWIESDQPNEIEALLR